MKRRFHKINIEISNICNLKCSFCPEVLRPKSQMDIELFRKVVAEAAPLSDQLCLHLMGEPLAHPRFQEFIEICDAHQAPIYLVTNGILLREKQAELLLHRAFRQVNFSLHSFHDNFPDRDPSVYLERIFAFTERAFIDRSDLYINYRLWNLESPHGTGAKNRETLKRLEERFKVKISSNADVRLHKSRRLKNRLYLHLDTEFVWPSLELPVLGEKGTCHGLSTHFGILADGTVVPCCLDKEATIPLGNARDQKIETILSSDRAKAMPHGFRRNTLSEELCRRCPYIQRFNP